MRKLPKCDISQAIKKIRLISADINNRLAIGRPVEITDFPCDAQVNELAVSVNELKQAAKRMVELHKASLRLAAARESLSSLEREARKTIRRNKGASQVSI